MLELSVSLLRIAALFPFFGGMQVVSAGALRGIGDVRGLWYGLSLGLFTIAMLMALRFEVLSKRLVQRIVADG